MTVFDSSALLALLNGEPGAPAVEARLAEGPAVVSTANWSEVAQKVDVTDVVWPLARDLLLGYDLRLEPVTRADAEAAARLWQRGSGLSLADRLCIALAERLGAEVVTADQAWSGRRGVVLIR